MLVIEIYEDVAVHSVTRQQDQHDEIRNEQRHIKGIGVVETPKRGIEKMLPNVMANTLGSSKRSEA